MIHTHGSMYRLDKIDEGIIRILSKDARTSLTDVAHQLNTSRQTINMRMLAMQEAGIIEEFTILVNWDLIEEE